MSAEKLGEPVDPENPPPLSYGTNDTQPPSYNDIADPPPSYDSIFGEIRAAKDESKGTLDFLQKFLLILVGTIGCTIFLALLLAIPIASIVIGVEYKGHDNCPVEPKISIYLIVLGSFGILRNLIGLWNQGKKKFSDDGSEEERDVKKTTCESLIDCFLLAWFICGNVWVYRNYKPSWDSSQSDYCNKTLYLYAFWLNTSAYIFMGLSCCCICLVGCCAAIFSSGDD